MPQIEQPPFLDLGQRPPHGFDELGGARNVGIVIVEPVPDPPRHLLPIVLIGEDVRSTHFVELRDPEFFDLLFARNPQLFFRLQLNGEPVRVPAGLPGHPVSGHRPVAGDQILDRSSKDVMHSRSAVRRGGTFEENELRRVRTVRETQPERVLLVPDAQNFFLEPCHGLAQWPIGHLVLR